jgi:hypothetical protein
MTTEQQIDRQEIDASIDEIKRLAASLGFRMELASDDTADQAPGDDDQVADDDTDDDAGDDLSVGFFVLRPASIRSVPMRYRLRTLRGFSPSMPPTWDSMTSPRSTATRT